jgi:orotidine-5'-phosphate decarboxylase
MRRLLVALDVPTAARALELNRELADVVGGVKVGSELFTAEGPRIVEDLRAAGARVFLDLKFHDIPNTVASGVRSAVRLGVWMLTVHASGGLAMMRAAAAAARETAASLGAEPPLIVGVTVLTSMNDATLKGIGVERQLDQQVLALAQLAREANVDGVVASPREVPLLRGHLPPEFVLVTPGVRPAFMAVSGPDDQARTTTPADAIAAGSTYLVVGRPIIAARSPREAALRIAGEMQVLSR